MVTENVPVQQTYDANRREVARLIYSLETFSQVQLVDELRARAADPANLRIDALETLEDYLAGLVNMGILSCRDGIFQMAL